ncbi:hypothetical protein H4696_004648 [Amycolatopsis lexingtonensis]|uniref:HEAT repeat domain-containing protein n=1 Tax=Amycolatopsis lexingtonensis TaxID=218822 RepID=A0ABR9I2W2_9PSEU|nr:hypothetical protein [Amycolatopsis lexingtonensis]MBE1497548.1 hypothetical protein [Amycolatopsis lexingtonensis]
MTDREIAAIVLGSEGNPLEKAARLREKEPGEVVAALSGGLAEAFANRNWSHFDSFVNVVGEFPSPSYLPVLIDALDLARTEPHVYALNIVYTLSDLAAPESVPVLARTVAWHRENDIDDDLAVNALDALLHIDTPESRAVLAAAVDDDREAVRELAREVAKRPGDFW